MPRLRRFQTRIATAMLALVVVIQLAGATAVYLAIRDNVVHRAEAELGVGERVFGRFMDSRTSQFSNTVEVLASDFAFKQAVATGDRNTIRSVLLNHGARVDADFAMLVSPDASLLATTLPEPVPGNRFPFPTLFARMVASGPTSAILSFRGKMYQLVAQPVYAPLPIGWVCMGFAIDDDVAVDIERLTSLDVSFVSRDSGSTQYSVASTLPVLAREALGRGFKQLESAPPGSVQSLNLDDGEYLSMALPLSDDANSVATVVLQNPLQAAFSSFRPLLLQLLGVTVIAVLVALVLSLFISRGLSRPLTALAGAVQRIEVGDYAQPVAVHGSDETSELASAFNRMQHGIAEREERIAFQARHDELTRLPNRAAVYSDLRTALVQTKRDTSTLAVLMLDINHFEEINDTLGHQTGDRVLVVLGERLRELLRSADVVGRIGGDEFLMVLPLAGAEDAAKIAAKIVKTMEAPVSFDEMSIDVSVSIGIALYPVHGEDPETLVRRADIAMYDAKQENSHWKSYERGRDERYLKRLELISDLRHAAERGEFSMCYQPKIDVQSRKVHGLEALLRWQHPHLGPVPPDEFIPLAEQTGNIGHITDWVLRHVIYSCRDWARDGWHPMVAVNLSPLDLMNSELPAQLAQLLEASGVPGKQLILEITEGAIMRDIAHAREVMRRLKQIGVELSIDDFGTGYSSLGQLRRLPLDELKIDKSFLMSFKDGASDDAAIVKSIIELAHNLGLRVTAEGVETDDCMIFLRQHHCDLAQGYFISKPLKLDALLDWKSNYIRSRTA